MNTLATLAEIILRRSEPTRTSEERMMTPFWLQTPTGFMAASWYASTSMSRSSGTAVVIIPGVAMEDRIMSVGITPLAERLADCGIPTLVAHLEGTSNSCSDLQIPGVASAWQTDVSAAVQHVRGRGFDRIVLIGVRLGGLLGLQELAVGEIDALVMWAPVLNGRRFVREAILLAHSSTSATGDALESECILVGTFVVHRSNLDFIKSMSADHIAISGQRNVLVIDDASRIDSDSLTCLAAAGLAVEIGPGIETAQWLYSISDRSRTPQHDIEFVANWIQRLRADGSVTAPETTSEMLNIIEFEHAGTRIRERIVAFGTGDTMGIFCDSVAQPSSQTAWTIITSPQPGHSFVQFARNEAASGRSSLRFDFTSHGLSRRQPGQTWGELYGVQAEREILAAKDWLLENGATGTAVLGFCASGMSTIFAGPSKGLISIVAINAPLFIPGKSWRTGDGVHGSRLRELIFRFDKRLIIQRVQWKYRTEIRHTSRALTGLLALHGQRVKLLLLYDRGDSGAIYFEQHASSRLLELASTDTLTLRSFEGLGHGLTGLVARENLLACAHEFATKTFDPPVLSRKGQPR